MNRSPPMRTYNLTHANDGASYPLDAHCVPAFIAHTKNEYEIRIISFRKATRCETDLYYREIAL